MYLPTSMGEHFSPHLLFSNANLPCALWYHFMLLHKIANNLLYTAKLDLFFHECISWYNKFKYNYSQECLWIFPLYSKSTQWAARAEKWRCGACGLCGSIYKNISFIENLFTEELLGRGGSLLENGATHPCTLMLAVCGTTRHWNTRTCFSSTQVSWSTASMAGHQSWRREECPKRRRSGPARNGNTIRHAEICELSSCVSKSLDWPFV